MGSYKNANIYYENRMHEFLIRKNLSLDALEELEAHYIANEASMTKKELENLVTNAHLLAAEHSSNTKVFVEAKMNYEGSKSRFGSQDRAMKAQNELLPILQASISLVKLWEFRAEKHGVILTPLGLQF